MVQELCQYTGLGQRQICKRSDFSSMEARQFPELACRNVQNYERRYRIALPEPVIFLRDAKFIKVLLNACHYAPK